MTKRPKGWYEALVIRPVVSVDGYENYEKVCGYVADIYFSVKENEIRQKLVTDSKNSGSAK